MAPPFTSFECLSAAQLAGRGDECAEFGVSRSRVGYGPFGERSKSTIRIQEDAIGRDNLSQLAHA